MLCRVGFEGIFVGFETKGHRICRRWRCQIYTDGWASWSSDWGLCFCLLSFAAPTRQWYNNLIWFLWGTFSINSESVVATVHELRSPSLGKCKSVRFSDDSGPDKAPSKAKGLPQHSQHQPLPHHRVIPNLVDGKQVQENKILTRSTPKQTPPCFKSRTYVVPYPTTERRIQASLPAGSLPGKHGPYSK